MNISNLVGTISLTLKDMGFNIEKKSSHKLKIDIQCNWPINEKKYIFFIAPSLNKKIIQDQEFKNTVIFCKSNNYQFIVISSKVNKEDLKDKDLKILNKDELLDLFSDYRKASLNL